MTTIAITNPSDESAESGIVEEVGRFEGTPRGILEKFGDRLEDGAQVTMIGADESEGRVWQYIATRDDDEPDEVTLRSNNGLAEDEHGYTERFIDFANATLSGESYIIEQGTYPLASPAEELETFTVFGNNDDSEDFVAVVSATEGTVRDAGIAAGLVDEGCEGMVSISLILKGDHSDAQVASV